MDREAFMATFGVVLDHSPWVAEAAWQAGPFDSLAAVQQAIRVAIDDAPRACQVALIRAHPDLACRAPRRGALTDESRREQTGAGLGHLSAAEYRGFETLNTAYKEKFGFPFVVAVKHLDKTGILRAFSERLENTREAEIKCALAEIHEISGFRLAELIEG